MSGATPVELTWSVHSETSLTPELHAELATVLRRIFPDDPRLAATGNSWAGGIPELRLIGRDGDRIVAHLAIVRRFLRSRESGESVLVGDVGLVGVDPDYRGQGLGLALLTRTAAELATLGVAFGTLTTGEDRVRFYTAGDWLRAENRMLHAIGLDGEQEHWDGPLLYLPVAASASSWPAGELERNGQEI